ncbi:thiamine-phosphate kinase [Agitococcus lubricus]|uniref:Thiamine-monophosphate kinase n=1 Tax=Agitococcus lubricus TaxID=1077255 RepID=A0A2T5IUH4_9GAMM|nr:thiamine-phosphate kinase [Agitococcus lubricus]PTQ87539.1 thiamine-monophosphate kinase [Agitococcus lubricus]
MPSEFELINRYFKRQTTTQQDVILGIGDDAALMAIPAGELLVATADTLVAGRHFPIDTPPHAIAYKALAVNLSDLAAMGATPRWFLLALTLEESDDTFLSSFAEGLFQLADAHQIALVGGDTTKGHLAMTITALGTVPLGQALCRQGAQVGDGIYVSGTVGDAGVGLATVLQQQNLGLTTAQQVFCRQRLDYPTPRLGLGQALRGLASACLDISDGLAQDLGHILKASQVGADIELSVLPLSSALQQLPPRQAWHYALTAGDDYELCFCLPDSHYATLMSQGWPITRIGTVSAHTGLRCWYQGQPYQMAYAGYQHF